MEENKMKNKKFISVIHFVQVYSNKKMKSKSLISKPSTLISKPKKFSVSNTSAIPTQFQNQVYSMCKQIPSGKVTTYKGLATAIGNPNAVRAVGSALRKNPYAPTVPCHRVVPIDLSLGGYSGSTDPDSELLRKKVQYLLDEGVKLVYSLSASPSESTILPSTTESSKLSKEIMSRLKIDSSCVVSL